MLQSPGHSPLHLSSPSPSQSQFNESSSSSLQLSNSNSKTLEHTRKKTKILDEDAYVAAIEKIIERDYFPDISKLKDRLDWLEAIKTRDPIQIREAQLKIIERRSEKVSAFNNNNNSELRKGPSRTPGSTFMRNFTPFDEFDVKMSNVNVNEFGGAAGGGNGESDVDTNVSLDEFFRRYTSEDNDSFNAIIEKVNRKRKERYDYLLEGEKKVDEVKSIEDVKRDRITDGFGTSGQPVSTLDGWEYKAKNLLMYHPSDNGEVALTEEEKALRLKGLTKEISLGNTRFHGKMMDTRPRDDGTVDVLYTPVAGGTPMPMSDRYGDKSKKYDLEDLKKTPHKFYIESEKKAKDGYSYVKTPSPAPGADESPFITWGEIEGTPLRLDIEETPIDIGGSGEGPQYNIPSAPSRDVRAHTLSREAARKIRERSRMFQKPPLPSPYRSGSASPNMRTLSPAAQKFVRNTIGKSPSSSVDNALRASYRGSSPRVGTPVDGRSVSRFGKEGSPVSKSPSVRDGSNPPW
ncbi:hypothetical protein ACFE04_029919 [Oxalis oulophora]